MSRPLDPASRHAATRAMKAWAAAALVCVGAINLSATLWPRRFKVFFDQIPGADKAGHFLVMGVLALVLVAALEGSVWRGLRLGALVLIAGTLALVTAEELSQLVIPGRTFSWLDLAYSWSGVLVGGTLGMLLRRRPWRTTSTSRRES